MKRCDWLINKLKPVKNKRPIDNLHVTPASYSDPSIKLNNGEVIYPNPAGINYNYFTTQGINTIGASIG